MRQGTIRPIASDKADPLLLHHNKVHSKVRPFARPDVCTWSVISNPASHPPILGGNRHHEWNPTSGSATGTRTQTLTLKLWTLKNFGLAALGSDF